MNFFKESFIALLINIYKSYGPSNRKSIRTSFAKTLWDIVYYDDHTSWSKRLLELTKNWMKLSVFAFVKCNILIKILWNCFWTKCPLSLTLLTIVLVINSSILEFILLTLTQVIRDWFTHKCALSSTLPCICIILLNGKSILNLSVFPSLDNTPDYIF